MSDTPETFASAVFIVDGKTVDANGKEVKAEKPAADTDTTEPAAKPTAKK